MDNMSRSEKVTLLVVEFVLVPPLSVAATGRRTGSSIKLDRTNIPNTGTSMRKVSTLIFLAIIKTPIDYTELYHTEKIESNIHPQLLLNQKESTQVIGEDVLWVFYCHQKLASRDILMGILPVCGSGNPL